MSEADAGAEPRYIPYEVALKIVGAVMEEEHLYEPERRILTVYDIQDRELCWFDAEEIMAELAQQEGGLLSLEATERRHIQNVLDLMEGNVTKAARSLGIDRVTLYNKIKKYGLKR